MLRCVRFVGASGGFCHDTHPLEDGSRLDPRTRRLQRGSDVERDARRTQPTQRLRLVLTARAERNSTWSVIVPETGTCCHLERTKTSVCPRFTGSSRTSHCLPLYPYGVPDVTHNRDRETKRRAPSYCPAGPRPRAGSTPAVLKCARSRPNRYSFR